MVELPEGTSSSSTFSSLVPALTVSLVALTLWVKWQYKYWDRLGVPYIKPTFPFGNLSENVSQKKSLGDLYADHYNELKSKSRAGFGGLFAVFRPVLMLTDPELIKRILVRDFEHFHDRGMYMNEKGDPLSAHLFNLTGKRWRNLRKKMTPIFSSGKMKYMFQTLVDCSQGIAPILEEANGEPVDVKDVAARFTTDVIGSCAFGVECNSLKDPNCDFRVNGRRTFERTPLEICRRFLIMAFPNLMLKLNVISNDPSLKRFFTEVVTETIAHREKSNAMRKDFMDLLIRIKAQDDGSDRREKEIENGMANGTPIGENSGGLTMEQIIAQSFVFFLAGFETSSTTLTFCLYELTQNLDAQERLRDEIAEVLGRYGGELSYEAVADMKYMGMCIDETLRKYPPLSFLNRVCTKHYTIPGTNIRIEKGTHVHIPIKGLQNDPEYFPYPEKFDPSRFTEENRKSRPDCTYLPFGEGPRVCLAVRFGIMQTKVGLTALVKNFRFTLSDRTKTPLKMNPKCAISTALGDVWLKAQKI